jgi:hypothetical protein
LQIARFVLRLNENMAIARLTLEQARASWWMRQWLVTPPPAKTPLADVVSAIGWIPLPSLVTAPLALFARGALADRATLDEAVCKSHSLVISPGPKGATWLVAAQEAPVCRAFAVADLASREARIAASVALTAKDLDSTREALRALLREPHTAEELKAKLPATAMRSLGDVGKRNGVQTLAALVLKQLWATGEVWRVPPTSRADDPTSRWQIDPHPRSTPSAADAVGFVAARWLGAFAPATLKTFANAFGLATGRARAALESIGAFEVTVDGIDEACWVPKDFAVRADHLELPCRLLPVRDPLTDVHLPWMSNPVVARAVTTKAHGVGATAIAKGEVVGGWAYDEGGRKAHLRWISTAVSTESSKALEAEAGKLSAWIASELGALPLHTVVIPRATGASELGVGL